MKENFKDLRDNYSGQINNQNCKIDDIKIQIENLKIGKIGLLGLTLSAGAVVVFMGIALFNHLVGK